MSRIFVYTGEPGGSNVVISLLKRLRSRGLSDFAIFTQVSSAKIYDEAGFTYSLKSPNHLDSEIFEKATLLITGASWPSETEISLWAKAKQFKVPSLSMLDQWMLYSERYSVDGMLSQDTLPDKIAVMDSFAKNEMLACGFPESKLVITGMAYLNDLPKVGSPTLQENDSYTLVFMSEPRKLGVDLGYDEFGIFKILLASCRRVFKNQKYKIIIKLHPRNQASDFDEVLKNLDENISLSEKEKPRELIKKADLIVGMSSMTLLESVLMGRATISIQIGLNRDDPFVLSRMGILPSVTNENELDSQLSQVLTGQQIKWSGPGDHLSKLDSWLDGLF